MTRDEILDALRTHNTALKSFGVSKVALFGSLARGEGGPDSDADILVEFETPVSIFKFLDVKDYLENLLGRPVDLVMRSALKPRLRDRILAEAVSAG